MIPVNEPLITKSDARAVYDSIKKGWISSAGPQVKIFETKFKKMIKKKYCSLVSNGTAALEIAVKSLNLKKNSEVIIPNFTIISNALAVQKQNLKPILIDCDLNNWNMKIEDIENAITKNTKAIIATHIYGYPIDMVKIKSICKKYNLYLIEDAAEMIGHKFKKKYCGSFGDISTFSFYSNKHITTGEGGAILTNSKKLDSKIKDLRNLCFGRINRYNHSDLGWNYRFTNIQASLGLSQLKRIKKIIREKKKIGKIYYKYLKNNNNIYIQKPRIKNFSNVYWVVGVVIKEKLAKLGIETRSFFWPMHKQEVFKKLKIKFNGNFPNSEYLCKYGFYLPSSLNLTEKKIKFICNNLSNLFKN